MGVVNTDEKSFRYLPQVRGFPPPIGFQTSVPALPENGAGIGVNELDTLSGEFKINFKEV